MEHAATEVSQEPGEEVPREMPDLVFPDVNTAP
jgi:hypothetical protein